MLGWPKVGTKMWPTPQPWHNSRWKWHLSLVVSCLKKMVKTKTMLGSSHFEKWLVLILTSHYENLFNYLILVWTLCLMHRCVCIWRYILQNYNYKLHFQNSLSSSPQAILPKPFHFLLPWKWTLHLGQAICALLITPCTSNRRSTYCPLNM